MLPPEVLCLVRGFASGWTATPSAQALKSALEGRSRESMRVRRATSRDYESMSVRVADWILEAKAWRRVLGDLPPTRAFLQDLLDECFERCCEIDEWRDLVEIEQPAPWLLALEKRHWDAFAELRAVGRP